jgi:hypothetical protein
MRPILRNFRKTLPLLVGTICTIPLFLAFVPGQLEFFYTYFLDLDGPFPLAGTLFTALALGVVIGLPLLCIMAIHEITQIFSPKKPHRQTPGIFSLLILAFTCLALFFHIPARLYFYTGIPQRAKMLVDQQALPSDQNKPFYFQTGHFEYGPALIDQQYGFAYLPEQTKTYYQTIPIFGRWYIFSGINWTGARGETIQRGD